LSFLHDTIRPIIMIIKIIFVFIEIELHVWLTLITTLYCPDWPDVLTKLC